MKASKVFDKHAQKIKLQSYCHVNLYAINKFLCSQHNLFSERYFVPFIDIEETG